MAWDSKLPARVPSPATIGTPRSNPRRVSLSKHPPTPNCSIPTSKLRGPFSLVRHFLPSTSLSSPLSLSLDPAELGRRQQQQGRRRRQASPHTHSLGQEHIIDNTVRRHLQVDWSFQVVRFFARSKLAPLPSSSPCPLSPSSLSTTFSYN